MITIAHLIVEFILILFMSMAFYGCINRSEKHPSKAQLAFITLLVFYINVVSWR